MQTPAVESDGRISPDGQWIAYQSNESGQNEIWVESFPKRGIRQRISATGGVQPRWSHDGTELYYRVPANPSIFMVVPIRSAGASLGAGAPSRLYDLVAPSVHFVGRSPDGRFLWALSSEQSTPPAITVILNWAAAK